MFNLYGFTHECPLACDDFQDIMNWAYYWDHAPGTTMGFKDAQKNFADNESVAFADVKML